MRSFINVLALCALLVAQAAAQPVDCSGTPNTHPVWEEAPTFVRNVTNGKLFVTGGPDLQPNILVAHLYGTPYEMGYAHGELLREEVLGLYGGFYGWVDSQIDKYIQFLPKGVRDWIEQEGVEFALNMTLFFNHKYIPSHFLEEAQGMADALNKTQDDVLRVNLFPSLIQAACSMFGAWGSATSGAPNAGSLYQLRALDFGTEGPMQKYPLLLTYHPSAPNSHNFTILTWAGMFGAITGYSSADIGICEKVWDAYKGNKQYAGIPWMFVLRDILQFDNGVDEAMSRLASAHRTCSIWVGIGQSHPEPDFKAVGYSEDEFVILNDHNMPDHPSFDDLVYLDKHVQPSQHKCFPSLLKEYYGQLDAMNTLRYITSQGQTGDLHLAIMDHKSREIYVSNASPYVNNSATPAYDRPFTRVSLQALFEE